MPLTRQCLDLVIDDSLTSSRTNQETPPDRFYRGPDLRTWQAEALAAWEANQRRGVIEAITGTGKSMVGVRAIRDVVAVGGKALVLVPTQALHEQWFTLLRQKLANVRVGKLGQGCEDSFHDHDILIATVQTASKSQPRPVGLGLLVADEIHRYGSTEFSKALLEHYEWRLGLTATLERLDDGVDRVLTPYFQRSVFQYGYEDALRDKVVAPFRLLLVGVDFTHDERERFRKATEKCSEARSELYALYYYPEDWGLFFQKVQAT